MLALFFTIQRNRPEDAFLNIRIKSDMCTSLSYLSVNTAEAYFNKSIVLLCA